MAILKLIFFVLGYSFLGSILPGVINLSIAKKSINSGVKEGIKMIFGVLTIIILVKITAFLVSLRLEKLDDFIENINIIGIVVFGILSIFFFTSAFKKAKTDVEIDHKKSSFLSGISITFLNFFLLPAHIALMFSFKQAKIFQFDIPSLTIYILANLLGCFIGYFLYAKLFNTYKNKVQNINKFVNIFLGIITLLISLISLVKLLMN